MKKTLVWGFHHPGQVLAIQSLEERGLIDVVCWIGKAKECDINILDLYKQRFVKSSYSGIGAEYYQDIYKEWFATFVEMYSRVPTTREMSVHEFVHSFSIVFDYFAALLADRKIEVVLFNNLPHFGVDLVLYLLAKKMAVNTVIFSQSLVPNRCFYMYRLEDYGVFEDIAPSNECLDLKIDKQHKKKLFYMAKIPLKQRFCMPNFVHELRRILLRRKSRKTMTSVLKSYRECRQYKKDIAESSSQKCDMERNYVYFPLHLQPELTTSALGGMYTDQLLAVERLSSIVPKGWLIYVKENPKQREEQRGTLFFRRLKMLDNVVLVSSSVDTYLLMENCRFVATITGTAGWEAISGGKSVLVFGKAWYRKLPGVFEYDENLRCEDISAHVFDHKLLEQKYNNLLRKTVPGVVDDYYKVLVPNYTPEENARVLSVSLEKAMENIPV